MGEEKHRIEIEEEKNTAKKVTRREALKRIALTAGGLGLLGTIPSWAVPRVGQTLIEKDYSTSKQVVAYYSWYSRYSAYYSYSSYQYSSYSYYSYKAPYYSYISYGPGGRPGATCFIDTLEKKKK
jgi:hypothetical protein